jgi:hypothetical protein
MSYEDTQTRITIAQAANIAKDLAIAKHGEKVTVKHVADMVEEVYQKVFQKVCADLANPPVKAPLTAAKHIAAIKKVKTQGELDRYRNVNLADLKLLNEADKKKVKAVFIKQQSTFKE